MENTDARQMLPIGEARPHKTGILEIDENGMICSRNEYAQELLGADGVDLSGKSFALFCRDTKALEILKEQLSSDEPSKTALGDEILYNVVGQSFWGRIEVASVLVPGGEPRRCRVAVTDIDLSKRAYLAVTQKEPLLDELFRYVDQMLWVDRSLGTENIYISPAYETLWGESVDMIRSNGGRWSDSIHEDDRATVLRTISERRSKGLPLDLEYRVVRPDGSIRWIWVKGFPYPDKTIHPDIYIGTATDITERKLHEIELARLQSLQNVGAISADLAHNFNNLLSIIELSVSNLTRGDNPNKLSSRLGAITNAVQRGKEITKTLLAVSSRQVPSEQQFEVNQSIRQLAMLLEASVGPHIALDFDLTPEDCAISADQAGFSQAIINLVTNSRDAMQDAGHIVIRTRLVESLHKNGALAVQINVEDTGPGMSDEVLRRATGHYFSTKAKGKGTGLGLAITNGFMTQSNGTMALANLAGDGFRVTLTFPELQRKASKSVDAGKQVRAPRILVIDDEADLTEIVQEVLEDQGYAVCTANSYGAAQQILLNSHFDVVLSDLALGSRQTGIDIRTLIRERCPETVVIFMSGYVPCPGELGRKVRFLQKPFRAEQLLEVIRNNLPQASRSKDLAA